MSVMTILIADHILVQGESKKTDTFDIQMNNKGVSFFWLTLYTKTVKALIDLYKTQEP